MTDDEIDAAISKLRGILGKGVGTVEYDGFRRTYYNPDQIAAAIDSLNRAKSTYSTNRIMQTAAVFSRD